MFWGAVVSRVQNPKEEWDMVGVRIPREGAVGWEKKNGSLSNLWGCLTQCFSHWPSCSWVLLRLSPRGFLGSPSGKEPACQCRRYVRHGFDPWVGKIPGGGHGNQLQYSCLGKSIDRGAWKATVHRVTESDMTEVT